tara:strand:- start:934 stop:1362 length:429 start_codon:yes stop_codon:yes gene_type:complete
MGVRNGKNYIISLSITPLMHTKLMERTKGSRSAFVRRAIYNALEYDKYVQKKIFEDDKKKEEKMGLLKVIRYLQARINSITSTGVDLPPYNKWEMTIYNYDYTSPEWTAAFDAIEELSVHIEGLNNAQLAFGGMEDGRREHE